MGKMLAWLARGLEFESPEFWLVVFIRNPGIPRARGKAETEDSHIASGPVSLGDFMASKKILPQTRTSIY